MGYDLLGVKDLRYRFNMWDWPRVLGLARAFGWEPQGTKSPADFLLRLRSQFVRQVDEEVDGRVQSMSDEDPPPDTLDAPRPEMPDQDWDGGYCSNDYQWVTPEDAKNLADALEKSLPHLVERPDGHGPPDIAEIAEERYGPDYSPQQLGDTLKEVLTEAHSYDPMRQVEQGAEIDPNALIWEPGDIDRIRGFIDFCRKTGFRIF